MIALILYLSLSRALKIVSDAGEKIYNHETASFGKQQPYDISGMLASPFDEVLCSPYPQNYTNFKDNIAFVLRGNCSFFQKAWIAQQAGAAAVIIGNNVTSEVERNMIRTSDFKPRVPDVAVPVAWISGHDFHEIAYQLSLNLTLKATLNREGEQQKGQTFRLVPPIVLILVWVAIIGMYFCRKLVMRYVSRQHRVSAMNVMPMVAYRPLDEEDNEAEAPILNSRCVICMEDFVEGEELKALPCRHGFHARCIDPWFANHSERCPVCNQSLLQLTRGEGSIQEFELEEKEAKEGDVR